MPALRLTGRPASPGFARGPIVVVGAAGGERRAAGDPAAEATALRAAIGLAVADLEDLAGRSGPAGAEILAVQVAFLQDDALAADAFAEIAAGVPADHAWRGALDREIAGYEAAEDEYFRARAADLTDLRDRVLDALAGANARAIPPGSIVFAADLAPSRFLAADGAAVPSFSPTAARRATLRCWRVAAACR